MADNNRNDRNQSYGSQDWDQNNRRFENDDTRENYSSYGNSSYQGNYGQTSGRYGNSGFDDNSDYRSGSNRNVNYMPDNDDNRNKYGSGGNQYSSGGSQYGSGSNQYSSGGNQYGSGGYNQRNEDFGGKWNQQNRQGGSSRNYGPSYGWGYGQQNQDWQDSNYGGYSPNYQNRDDEWNRSNRGSSISQGSSYGSSGNQFRDHDDYGGRYRNSGMGGSSQGSNYGRYSDRDRNRGNDRDWWDRTKDEVSSWFGDDSAERRREMDKRRSGEHKGKGPRGYQRSTDRIKEDVCDRLAEDDYVDASDIDIKVEDNEVILTGTVNSREEKRRAEDLVESISGVKNVENRIKVARPDVGRTETTNTIIRKKGNMDTGKTDI